MRFPSAVLVLALVLPFPSLARADADADAKRQQQAQTILQALTTVQDRATRSELTFRLSEIYWEQAQAASLREMAALNAAMERWVAGGRKGAEPAVDARASTALKRQALHGYDLLLKRDPGYARHDEVLRGAAMVNQDLGKRDVAARLWAELLRKHPDSAFAADAYLALGEQFFDANDLSRARTALSRALALNKKGVSEYARYRLAWCDYNSQDFTGALEGFQTVIAESRRAGGTSGVRLGREALQDLPLTYSRLGEVDGAWAYFSSVTDATTARALMRKLAGHYESAGQGEATERTYRLLIRASPLDANAADNHAHLVRSLARQNNLPALDAELDALPALFGATGAWVRRHPGADRSALEDAVRGVATEAHAAATRHHRPADMKLAEHGYAVWLALFDGADGTPQMHFNLAELLYDASRWPDSARHYERAAAAPDAALRHNAQWNRVLALEKQVKAEAGVADAREDLSPTETALVTACDQFVEALGPLAGSTQRRADVLACRYSAARVFQVHGRFSESAPRLVALMDDEPDSPQARRAALDVMDGEAAQRDWAELERVARRITGSRQLMQDRTVATQAAQFLEGAVFNRALARAHEADDLDAAGRVLVARTARHDAFQQFMAARAEFTRGAYVEKSTLNALLLAETLELLDVAIRLSDGFLADHPSSEHVQRVAWKRAVLCERVADYERAARHYQAFYEDHPRAPQAPDGLFNAAVLRQALGQRQRAVEMYRRYLAFHGERADAADAYWRLARLFEDDGRYAEAARWYAEFDQRFPAAPRERSLEARYLHAVALTRLAPQQRDGLRACAAVVAEIRGLPKVFGKESVVRRAAAHCRFLVVEERFAEMRRIRISGNASQVQALITRKARLLSALQQEYADIIAYQDGEWAVAALYRMATAQKEFSDGVRAAPEPRTLTAEQRDLYRAELEASLAPVDANAAEALETAVARAFELGIYSEWTFRAQELLQEYRPEIAPLRHRVPFRFSDGAQEPGKARIKGGAGRPI